MKKTIFMFLALAISMESYAGPEAFSGEEYQKAQAILVKSLRHKLSRRVK